LLLLLLLLLGVYLLALDKKKGTERIETNERQ
jgi:hypothetical protein